VNHCFPWFSPSSGRLTLETELTTRNLNTTSSFPPPDRTMASKEKKTCVEDPLPLFGQRQDDPNSDTKPQLGAGDGRKPDGVKVSVAK
jgi:hypothetical protein